ncbi:MAG: asparagine synthase (glutamine-hydrolyzing) [Cyclobacteriaceae bacterium]|nr:asparagine synthase (glutamine-hydrolyzing) [Cyclobacteriaceae bacterium]
MCGFNFILDKKLKINEVPIARMASATQHRGPDETSQLHFEYLHKSRVYFSASRLAITDQSLYGSQPMQSHDGRYVLVYNGEIYNYIALRNKLETLGCHFYGQSDTEVLLHWLILHRESGQQALEGMYSFVFADLQEGLILMARDPSGMKPLFYYQNEDFIIASSEIRGIMASSLIEKSLNTGQIQNYLSYRYPIKPETLINHVYELEDGCQIRYLDGKFYHHKPQQIADTDKTEARPGLKDLENVLQRAIQRHIQTAVPGGLLLSGGVDSTLLLALLQQQSYNLPVFSLVNSENERAFGTQDYLYARKAAKQFGAEHHCIEMKVRDLDLFEDFLESVDQPVADHGAYTNWLICRYASDHVKYVISGAGADELFAGYNRHWAYYQYLRYYRILMPALPLLKYGAERLPDGFDHPFRKSFRLYKKLISGIDPNPETTFLNFQKLKGLYLAPDLKNDASAFALNAEILFRKALYQDEHGYLSSDVLAISDQMSMRWGLEMRMPYLDENVKRLAQNADALYLISKGRKWMLKKLLQNMGAAEFAYRKKEGFGLPFGKWLRKKEGRYLLESLYQPDAALYQFVSFANLKNMIDAHTMRKADFSQEIWACLLLQKWMEKHF